MTRQELEELAQLVAELVFQRLQAASDDRILVDVREAAKMLGITEAALRARVQRGLFARGEIVRTGRRIQFRVSALRRLR